MNIMLKHFHFTIDKCKLKSLGGTANIYLFDNIPRILGTTDINPILIFEYLRKKNYKIVNLLDKKSLIQNNRLTFHDEGYFCLKKY